ncbi:MAG: DMT family transporter [Myxococcota bacterium]
MPSGVGAILLSSFAFSVMALFVKLAGERIPSQEIVFARSLVSGIVSYALLRRAGIPIWGHDRRGLWLRGLTGYVALSCVYAAVTHLPLADATVIHYLNPAFTALLAGLFLGEPITRATLVATSLCLTGVVLVARPESLFGVGADALDPVWVGVAVAGALGSALAYVVVRRLARTEHPLVIVFYFPLVNLVASLPLVLGQLVWPVGIEWVWLVGVGLATQVGQMALTAGLMALPAGQATSLSYLQVVFAAVFGVVVFDEWPDVLRVAGATLVVAGSLSAARAARPSPMSASARQPPDRAVSADSSRGSDPGTNGTPA